MRFRGQRSTRLLPDQLVVTGERHHSDNIQAVLSQSTDGRLQYQCNAVLARELGNDSDPHAVGVLVNGLRVGYIARIHSEDVSEVIGDRNVELKCVINWNGEVLNGIYRVKLFPTFWDSQDDT